MACRRARCLQKIRIGILGRSISGLHHRSSVRIIQHGEFIAECLQGVKVQVCGYDFFHAFRTAGRGIAVPHSWQRHCRKDLRLRNVRYIGKKDPCLLGSRRLRSIGSRLRGPLGECPRPRSLAMASWLRKSLRRKGSAEYSWKNMESAGRSIFAEKNALRYIQL